MFDFVRTHQRWLQFILLLLILPAFVLTGVASFGGGATQKDVLATVGNRAITQAEFAARYGQVVQQARAQMGEKFNEAEFKQPEQQSLYLTQMVNEAALEEMLASEQMSVPDGQVQQTLAKMQGIPQTAQGTIDVAAYKQILAAQGLTPAQHQNTIRLSLMQAQMEPAIANLVLPDAQSYWNQLYAQARVVEVKSIDLDPFMAQVKPTEAEIQSYYAGHTSEFSTPEMFSVDYVVLPAQSSVSDEDIRKVFGQQATPADVAKVRQDPTQMKIVNDQVVLKKRVAEIDALVAKNPQDLAAIAQAYKAQVQSAKELLRTVDAKTPEIFRTPSVRENVLTVQSAESKNIAPVMALDSGALLLARVTDYRPAAVTSFEVVKSTVEQKVRRDLALPLALEQTQKSVATINPNLPIAEQQSISWLSAGTLSQELVTRAMPQPIKSDAPSVLTVIDSNRVSLVRVVKQLPLPEDQSKILQDWVKRTFGGTEEQLAFSAYMNAVRQRMGVKMFPERIKP